MLDFLFLAQAPAVDSSLTEFVRTYGTLAMLLLFIAGSMWIGLLANRATRKGSFLKGFFLGNRGLGAWALALTATVQSGGTFMGFPSLVYSHGWSVALWIGGYMVVPITGFGILGKRLAQLSRRTGAITIPDLFRARFNSPILGLIASLFILFYMSFMMVAQFKAGALVMKLSWPGSGALALSEDAAAYTLSEAGHAKLDESIRGPLSTVVGQSFRDVAAIDAELKSRLSASDMKQFRSQILQQMKPFDYLYFIGLGVFTATVVGYTLLGGFLAAVWTDLFQSVLMWIGILLLLVLTLSAAGGLQYATLASLEQTGPGYLFGPGYDHVGDRNHPAVFMPIGLAASAFCVWVFSGLGSPAGMVRVMASESTGVIRRSIFLLSVYNFCIYLPLIVICICGRALIPNLGTASDEIIPRLALMTTAPLPGGSLIAGLILAAPFGAVMATVSSYLVVISSGLVRDVYQRFINPGATQEQMRRLSYITMIVVGLAAIVANLNPVTYLQAIVVFSGTGGAATFCVPALMLAYWRRATVAGTITSMVTGAGTVLTLYALPHLRWLIPAVPEQYIGQQTAFRPYFLLQIDPIIWGLAMSLITGVIVSLATRPPEDRLVSKMFDATPME